MNSCCNSKNATHALLHNDTVSMTCIAVLCLLLPQVDWYFFSWCHYSLSRTDVGVMMLLVQFVLWEVSRWGVLAHNGQTVWLKTFLLDHQMWLQCQQHLKFHLCRSTKDGKQKYTIIMLERMINEIQSFQPKFFDQLCQIVDVCKQTFNSMVVKIMTWCYHLEYYNFPQFVVWHNHLMCPLLAALLDLYEWWKMMICDSVAWI